MDRERQESDRDFVLIAGEALQETREKFDRYWKEPAAHRDAVNFALGLFTGIACRRLRGEPDPDTKQSGLDLTPPGAQSLKDSGP